MLSRGFDAILLLGVELDVHDQPTRELRLRVKEAADALHQGRAPRIIACGGTLPGHARAEAAVMAELLREAGVPQDALTLEAQSQDTMQNMRNAAAMLGGAKGRRVLVVTSDYHLRRAVMTARRVGFAAKGRAAALVHDAAWKQLRAKELLYTLDLLAGWQDEGKGRPAWTYALFEKIFGKKEKDA